MSLKNFSILIIFLFFVACETGAKEEEQPNELKKGFNESFSLKKNWSRKAFKNLPLGKIKISLKVIVFSSSCR